MVKQTKQPYYFCLEFILKIFIFSFFLFLGRVDGSYSVLMADGRLMTVSYYVDGDSGSIFGAVNL